MPADYDAPDVSIWFFTLSPCHACQLDEAQKGETLFAELMLYGHGVGPDQQKLSAVPRQGCSKLWPPALVRPSRNQQTQFYNLQPLVLERMPQATLQY